MNTILLLRVGLFLALVLTAFLLLKYLKEHKVLSSVADSVYEKAKAQESERQAEQQLLILLEGRQEKLNLLYKLDLLVLQSNIRKYIPFASTEILIVMTIILAAAAYGIVAHLTGIWIFGMLGFAGVGFLCYMVLYFMALSSYRKTEESLMTFINLLENYSSMEDELIAIFSRIQTFLTEPIKSAVEQCCIEAEMTGDKGRAIRNLEKRIEHEKFKELVRNLEICSRYEANYGEVIKDSRSLLREYLAAAKERKAILNNARIEIAMIIGCSGIVFWMMNDFTQAGIMSVLLGSMVGNIILAYCILMLLYAVWTVAIDRH
mgnify:FL=1